MAALQSGYIKCRAYGRALRPAIGDAAMVRTVLALGESLGSLVPTEGIEIEAQAMVDAFCLESDSSKPSEFLIFTCVVDAKDSSRRTSNRSAWVNRYAHQRHTDRR